VKENTKKAKVSAGQKEHGASHGLGGTLQRSADCLGEGSAKRLAGKKYCERRESWGGEFFKTFKGLQTRQGRY